MSSGANSTRSETYESCDASASGMSTSLRVSSRRRSKRPSARSTASRSAGSSASSTGATTPVWKLRPVVSSRSRTGCPPRRERPASRRGAARGPPSPARAYRPLGLRRHRRIRARSLRPSRGIHPRLAITLLENVERMRSVGRSTSGSGNRPSSVMPHGGAWPTARRLHVAVLD